MFKQTLRDFTTSSPARLMVRLGLVSMALLLFVVLTWALFPGPSHPALADAASPAACDPQADYEARRAGLLVSATLPFTDDVMRDVETELDRQSFAAINAQIDGPKLIDNGDGWVVEARTGGRPFMNFDEIQVNCTPWTFAPISFTLSPGAIEPITLTEHFNAGKTVNRLWFMHQASNYYPIVVVMTPDGFFNIGGATSPTLQGAAARMGFIGEPFGDSDYLQHVDEINVVEIDDDTLHVIYNIHSEAGEGTLMVELHWNAETESPELSFSSAHVSRLNARLGFAGLNFMRGPTLWGRASESGTPETGIEAFHDGRSVFLVNQNGAITRSLLIPPVLTTTVLRQDLGTNVAVNSKLVMDQPQNVDKYFSEYPDPLYDERTDLILKLTGSTAPGVSVRRAQKAVNLALENPEADETVNVFYAAEMITGTLYDFEFTLDTAAKDFEQLYAARPRGVIFRSDRAESHAKLYFMPLDNDLVPSGPAEPLTDGVITDPHRPAVYTDERGVRFVIFDADDYKSFYPSQADHQRIYTLDLYSSAVRRTSSDPFGNSQDLDASFNSDGTWFAMISNRSGLQHLTIEDVAAGIGTDPGNTVEQATAADWSHERDEIAYVSSTKAQLWLYDVQTDTSTFIVARSGITNPTFSPSGDKIAYGAASELYVVNRSGVSDTLIPTDSNYATWVDEHRLIVQRTVGVTTDLYLVNIHTPEQIQLTQNAGNNTEPVFVGAVGPAIWIETPLDNAQVPGCVYVAGFVASAGVPTVTLNGASVTVNGDQWSTILSLESGVYTLTAIVTDSATGLTAQDVVTSITVAAPVLTISKSGPSSVRIGELITYTLRVTNSGSLSATDVVITDAIPFGADLVSSNGGGLEDNVISWTIGTLAPNIGVTQTIFVVTADVTATHVISNSDYGVRTSCGYGATGDKIVVTHIDIPKLTVSKQATPDLVRVGERLTYTIRVTNTGNVDLHAAITDTLPAQVTTTGTVAWPSDTIVPGEVWTETVVVTVTTSYTGAVTNEVNVTTEEGVTGLATATIKIADLMVSKQVTPDLVRVGERLTYTIRVTNTGNVDLHAAITDTLPAQVTPTGIVTWNPVFIAPGEVWPETVVVTVTASYTGAVTNQVDVTTEEGVTGFATETIKIADLMVSKQATPDLVRVGERLTYTIRVTNTGNVDLQATITDTLPAQVTPTGIVTWSPATIAPGDVWTETVVVTVTKNHTCTATNIVEVVTQEGAMGTASVTIRINYCVYLPLALRVD